MSDIPWYGYVLEDGLIRALGAVERDLGAISRASLIPEVRLSLQKQARRRSSRGSAGIEGVTLETAALQAIDRGLAPSSRNEREVAALMALYDWVQEHSPGFVITEKDLRRIHQLVWDKIIVKTMSGRYRRDAVGVWDGPRLVYEAPAAEKVPGLMAGFGEWLSGLGTSELHPVLASGIAQLQFIRIHPYMDGNGRCSRALSALVLRCSGYDAGGLLAHEDQILQRIDDFYEAIETSDRERDMTPWLRFYVTSLAEEVSAVLESVDSLNAQEPGLRVRQLSLSSRQRLLLQLLRTQPTLSPRDVPTIPRPSFYRDIQKLVDAGLVVARGEKRGRFYELASA